LRLPGTDLAGAVELRADVVLLDPVAVDHLQRCEALPGQVVGQVRAEGAGAAERDRGGGQLRQAVGAAGELLASELARHGRLSTAHRRGGCTRQYHSSSMPSLSAPTRTTPPSASRRTPTRLWRSNLRSSPLRQTPATCTVRSSLATTDTCRRPATSYSTR